jgi:hypothetical protein
MVLLRQCLVFNEPASGWLNYSLLPERKKERKKERESFRAKVDPKKGERSCQ